MTNNAVEFELRHVSQWAPWIAQQGWSYLVDGHDRCDSRCQGGAWYYRGDRDAAMRQVEVFKREQAARAAAYYAQPWV